MNNIEEAIVFLEAAGKEHIEDCSLCAAKDLLIKKAIDILESAPQDEERGTDEAGELRLSEEFVQDLIKDINQSTRLEKLPSEALCELLTNRVWGHLRLMTFESNVVDAAISRIESQQQEIEKLKAKLEETEDKRANAAFDLRKAVEVIRGKNEFINSLGREIDRLKEQIQKMHEAGLGPDYTDKVYREQREEIDRLKEWVLLKNEKLDSLDSVCEAREQARLKLQAEIDRLKAKIEEIEEPKPSFDLKCPRCGKVGAGKWYKPMFDESYYECECSHWWHPELVYPNEKRGTGKAGGCSICLYEEIEKLKTELEETEDRRANASFGLRKAEEVIRGKDKFINSLVKENKELQAIIKEYLAHCGTNMQICGLNTRAKQALKGESDGTGL
jgi:hypothetical protein